MKKLLLASAAIIQVVSLTAQNIKFGVTGGITIANQKFKSSGLSLTGDSKVGFTGGVLVDLGLGETFIFQPGLNFTQKGSKFSSGGETVEQTLNYIELPLNFLYKAEAGSGSFFGGIGPVLGYGISGKYKASGQSADIHFGNDELEDDYKAFEFAGNIIAGYEFSNGFFASANYNLGFSNLLINPDSGDSGKNKYFGIKVGYKFGGSGK
jgi:hypothetical protein